MTQGLYYSFSYICVVVVFVYNFKLNPLLQPLASTRQYKWFEIQIGRYKGVNNAPRPQINVSNQERTNALDIFVPCLDSYQDGNPVSFQPGHTD